MNGRSLLKVVIIESLMALYWLLYLAHSDTEADVVLLNPDLIPSRLWRRVKLPTPYIQGRIQGFHRGEAVGPGSAVLAWEAVFGRSRHGQKDAFLRQMGAFAVGRGAVSA